jgi:2-polyprenyl-3-methyl-5-hydroxy-6-metoxy-1,4-benzoquinol methylase
LFSDSCQSDRPAVKTLKMTFNLNPSLVAELARDLYTTGPAVMRLMQHYRPYISPFHLLLQAIPEGSRVLDIGCGGGLFLGLLARTKRIQRGRGIDTSAPAIAVALAMVNRLPAGHGLRFEVRGVALALPDEGYDVVALLDVMHHIPTDRQRGVLEHALQRVEPGGRFIYKDMVLRPWWRALANRLHDLVIARQWIHYLPLHQVVAWAQAEGFTVVEQRTVNMLWYGHEWVVFQAAMQSRGEPASLRLE